MVERLVAWKEQHGREQCDRGWENLIDQGVASQMRCYCRCEEEQHGREQCDRGWENLIDQGWRRKCAVTADAKRWLGNVSRRGTTEQERKIASRQLIEQHFSIFQDRRVQLGMLLPGITVNTGPNDYFPVKQMQMFRFTGEHAEMFGPVISGAGGM